MSKYHLPTKTFYSFKMKEDVEQVEKRTQLNIDST